MVARTPPRQKNLIMVAPLNPILIRETVKKVDQCMERLQELQYTVTGGTNRSTRGYLKTSLRCKQESVRIRSGTSKKSPTGKFSAGATGEWRRMSLTAMLVGETVGEILQASKFAKETVETMSKYPTKSASDDPKTPVTLRGRQRPNPENTGLEARRKREKQHLFRIIRSGSSTPTLRRARSRINFKVSPPRKAEFHKENCTAAGSRYLANRVSPKNRPWVKKTVLFPNPLFHSSPNSQHQKFCKTKSPIIAKKNNKQTPHKFLIKSPPSATSKFQVKIKSPVVTISPPRPTAVTKKSPVKLLSTASKLRRSLSPYRLANRMVSPLRSRRNVQKKSDVIMMSGLKQRPTLMMPMRFSARNNDL
ncbi:hypothetical protein Nepgr_001557 [Nepenthes gracilis]|uniref:Microtubule-binding protein TANGLED n=1 Tax=Nepenthes gracilis TaxID=150966 RepID=A0AAD3RXN5_NEPGR|nr:hypothetical protein Nepgr_001557 [Nepenthes gracilis]